MAPNTRMGRYRSRPTTDAVEVGVGVVVVRVDEDRVQAGRPRPADVHRHRVADVGDAIGGDAREVHGGVVEDRRVGLGDADDVAVDHAPHLDAVTRRRPGTRRTAAAPPRSGRTRWTRRRAARRPRPAPPAPHARRDRPPPQRRASVCGRAARRPPRRRPSGTPTDVDVRPVVVAPVALVGTLRRLHRHRRVVRPPVALDLAGPAVVGEQRAEHVGIGQDQHAARRRARSPRSGSPADVGRG